jgi:periplasmic copper chaperone A
MLVRARLAVLLGTAMLFFAPSALAHVSVTSPGYAGQNQVLTFSVGHGCEGADTFKLEVTIPKEVTSLRAVPSLFGEAELKADAAGVITSVVWTKSTVRPADDQYYQLQLRIKVPDAPFTTLYFPTKQSCRTADGKESTVDWAALPVAGADPSDEEGPPPAPALVILPTRVPGWNKYTVKNELKDLTVFNDAQIIWAGDAAYSGNAATADLIKAEEGVEPLTTIKAGAEIWVKY